MAEAWDTARIREAFIYDGGEAEYHDPEHGAQTQRQVAGEIFDRWLAAHDAEVRAGVVTEEPEGRRQYTAAYRATNGNVIPLETPNMLREAAERTVAEFADEDPEGPDYFVATRILPPWVPVKREGAET